MPRRCLRLRDFYRIAIVQMAYLGDVALTLPLAEALRQIHPEARRALVVIPAAAPLAACAEAVDEVIVYDKRGVDAGFGGLRRCAQRLRQWGAELLLVLHRSLRTALLARWSSPQCAIGSSRSALPWVYALRIPYGWHLHEVERNLSFLSVFAEVGEQWRAFANVSVRLRPLGEAEQQVERLLQSLGIRQMAPLVVLAPGSAWQTKRWSPRHYATLARQLRAEGCSVVVTGALAEKALCEEIARLAEVPSLAGRLEIPELLALFRRTACVVCNDSAPIHLAELVGTPVVALFGPTIPEFGFAPRLPRSCVIGRSLPCRPCSIHGGRRCPLGTHACLEGILPQEVLPQVLARLR